MINSESDLARLIDQTNLNLGATRRQIQEFCEEALPLGFAALCVLPNMVPVASRATAGSATVVAACISFPLGMDLASTKTYEAREAQEMGAGEIDMVIHTGRARAADTSYIAREVGTVRRAVPSPHLLKVIIEMPLLSSEQARLAALAAEEGGADLVKTSTGFKPLKIRATTVADVLLLRAALGPSTGIKAAGGIRSLVELEAMVEAGATRIGTSSGIAIVEEHRRRLG
ncbi:MAG: deoxyribose-phosphate aldolase [Candidatus Dormiibacterota bacterium]